MPFQDLKATDPYNRRDPESPKGLHHGGREGSNLLNLHVDPEETFVFDTESAFFIVLHPEGLDDTNPGDGLVDQHGQIPDRFLASRAELEEFPPKGHDGIDGDGKDQHGDTRQLPVAVEDDKDEPDDGEEIPQQARHRPGNGSP